MAYDVSQIGGVFFLRNDRKRKALDALKKAARPDGICGVTADDVQDTETLEELLSLVEWEPEVDDRGNVISIWFQGDNALEDIRLMDALAPFVRDGGFIRMVAEDGVTWEWRFDHGRCEEVILDQTKRWEPVEVDGDRESAAG